MEHRQTGRTSGSSATTAMLSTRDLIRGENYVNDDSNANSRIPWAKSGSPLLEAKLTSKKRLK
jgi:hypothetical protein